MRLRLTSLASREQRTQGAIQLDPRFRAPLHPDLRVGCAAHGTLKPMTDTLALPMVDLAAEF